MEDLRSREWVAIAALVVAIAIAFGFCNPAAGRGTVERPISHGEVVPTPTPPGPPTPTPVPTVDLEPPVNWFLRYVTSNRPGWGVDDSLGYVDELDIAFETAPYPGLHDDDWLLTASAKWDVPEGRYAFTLERDCELEITINGIEVRSEPDGEGGDHLRVVFDHRGGTLHLTITAVDRQGPFLLRWV